MANPYRLGRLVMLAVGVGVGAALAYMPGVASADSSTDPFSWLGGMDPADMSSAATTSPLDYQISIDGYDLFATAGNEATATSGSGDIAVAFGDGASAAATGGSGDFASASGTDSLAEATGGDNNSASALGTYAEAIASSGNNDVATSINLGGSSAEAEALSGNNNDVFIFDTGNNGDFAYAGGLPGIAGDNDIATVIGSESSAISGADLMTAVTGSNDLAAVFGNMLEATATGGNYMADILPSL